LLKNAKHRSVMLKDKQENWNGEGKGWKYPGSWGAVELE
jgi:hypothetical protein